MVWDPNVRKLRARRRRIIQSVARQKGLERRAFWVGKRMRIATAR